MALIATIEIYSQHPIANAFVRSAAALGVYPLTDVLSGFSIIPGEGLEPRIVGYGLVRVGNDRMRERCFHQSNQNKATFEGFQVAYSLQKQNRMSFLCPIHINSLQNTYIVYAKKAKFTCYKRTYALTQN